MKRLTMLIGTIVVSCLVLFGIRKNFETATAGDPQTIIVYNWGDYIDPELITQFEEETGYKVIYETFDSNEAMLTGESDLVLKEIGDQLLSGSFLASGQVLAQVSQVGANNYAAKLMLEAKTLKPLNSRILDSLNKIAAFTGKIIIPCGLALFFEALLIKQLPVKDSVINSSTALLGMLPKGIALLTITSLLTAVIKLGMRKVLVQEMYSVETLAHVDTLCLDKTGTITEGKPKVQSIEVFDNSMSENEMIGLAGAAEEQSSHPLATAIMTEIKDRGIEIPKHSKIKTVVSRGVETKVGKGKEAKVIRVGSKKYMLENNVNLTAAIDAERGIISRGEIGLYIAQDDKIIGLIGVSDPPRENIKKAINRLRNYGVDDIVLLTGDLRQQAETIASRMSIDRYESELLPEDKAKNILKFQSKGSNVIMIGDGVNDAPALSYANVGVALGSTRTDVAMEAADITITQDNPLLVPGIIGLSKNTVKTIKENFAMVIGLNTFALVLGATGILAPIYASVLHNSTTILVVLNSLKLLKYDIKTN